jgi:5-carboxymethyl-2-hydroxymuconate isomerase
MPHLTLEYTKNINSFDAGEVLPRLNRVLLESGQFEEEAIKSRAIELKTFCLGVIDHHRRFVHVRVSIMSGRSTEIRKALSQNLMGVLRTYLKHGGDPVAVSVEIAEIQSETYLKETIS